MRTPDYYLTTVLKDTKKTGSHCAATAPRLALFSLCICAKLLEPLGHQRSSVDGLFTPTFTMSPLNLPRKELRYIQTQVVPIEMSEKLRSFLLGKI